MTGYKRCILPGECSHVVIMITSLHEWMCTVMFTMHCEVHILQLIFKTQDGRGRQSHIAHSSDHLCLLNYWHCDMKYADTCYLYTSRGQSGCTIGQLGILWEENGGVFSELQENIYCKYQLVQFFSLPRGSDHSSGAFNLSLTHAWCDGLSVIALSWSEACALWFVSCNLVTSTNLRWTPVDVSKYPI